MKSLRHRLPTLTSLMVFEAAGRRLNFTQAARELHVSQAAVSKQIKYLEDYFGFALFERQGRKVSLSPRGMHLHNKVNASFNFLADAVEDHLENDEVNSVTVSANTAMSHYWLGNAINVFYRAHNGRTPNIKVITSDITRDLFVMSGYCNRLRTWAAYRLNMNLLFEEEMFPVASSEYLAEHPFEGMTHVLCVDTGRSSELPRHDRG
eukprot:TRINITY_DN12005_c0_g1_i1.p1 TRINITY_DN12005_c0_g1~~TRINITY_DN12005_c0_g1_i1.p1  ORF type:complete len:207 (+),score=38.43 TRINITY_DN12005_c0_g1_i1:350-970(+)